MDEVEDLAEVAADPVERVDHDRVVGRGVGEHGNTGHRAGALEVDGTVPQAAVISVVTRRYSLSY